MEAVGFLIPSLAKRKAGVDCTFLHNSFSIFTSQEGPVQRLLPPMIASTPCFSKGGQVRAGHQVSTAGERTVLQEYASGDADFFELRAGG